MFGSIEEYLGANTQAYYDVLGTVGEGSWQPGRTHVRGSAFTSRLPRPARTTSNA